jgi:valyl-tRNA synthetase
VAAEEREATWWTLVETLDTYLRLLHPVMPFVTETLWAAIPHRATDPELLIVADWPAAGERDRSIEARLDTLFETITAIRNARATARIDATQWLETHIALGGEELPLFQALAPAIERLARARPLALHPRSAELPRPPGSLEIVLPGADAEATVLTGASDDSARLERARLEKELAEAEGWLEAARARLANEAFIGKAPVAVVEGARAREHELAEQVDRLRERLAS